MSFIKKTVSYLSLCLLLLAPLAGQDHRVENQPNALERAHSLTHYGILKQKENGFVYLDLSNEFITAVVPLLDHKGRIVSRPTAARSMGAHISVFDEKENISPKELGAAFSFEVKEIRSFTLHTRDGLKKLWVIALNSPELENLREQYGCAPKLKGYDFHITLGKQMPSAQPNWETIETLSSFNFSDEPVDDLFLEGDFVTVENAQVLKTAAKVNALGQLKLKQNGYVYLDVSNQFVDEIFEQLPCSGSFTPVSTKAKKTGAHISVIYEDEMIGHEIWDLKEAGEWFTFEVKHLRYVDKKNANGVKRLWLLAVDAPALQRLRTHYGLKPKLQGHDFHITLGTEELAPSASYIISSAA